MGWLVLAKGLVWKCEHVGVAARMVGDTWKHNGGNLWHDSSRILALIPPGVVCTRRLGRFEGW